MGNVWSLNFLGIHWYHFEVGVQIITWQAQWHHQAMYSLFKSQSLQGGPLPVINGYNLHKWPYKWVTGVTTLLMVVITPLITDRGPPCNSSFLLFVFLLIAATRMVRLTKTLQCPTFARTTEFSYKQKGRQSPRFDRVGYLRLRIKQLGVHQTHDTIDGKNSCISWNFSKLPCT